ncbi:MAG: glycosyltransferase family 4 protein, partial [Turicibacter sp.]
MKILITTDTYYPTVNGVAVSTDNLYRQLKKLGHDVKILTLSTNVKERIEGDVYYYKSYHTNVYPDARIMKPTRSKILKSLIEWDPDIIHTQSEFSTMVLAKYIKRKLQIPQVHTYHTMYEDYLHYFMGGKVLRKRTLLTLTRGLLSTVDTVIAPAQKVKEKLESYQVGSNIEIVPTGINLNKFKTELTVHEKEELLLKYDLVGVENRLVYVGRIAKEKNIEEILTLFNKSLHVVTNTKLLIVGGGPYLLKLKQLVKDLGLEDDVKFAGMVDINETYKYYQLGTIFVTASTSETQGITYIEAMASGLPILCRYDLCIKDLVINGETGFAYENEEEFMTC